MDVSKYLCESLFLSMNKNFYLHFKGKSQNNVKDSPLLLLLTVTHLVNLIFEDI